MRILFRISISQAVGSGHFMRSLALAQACLDQKGKACFLTSKNLSPSLIFRLDQENISHLVLHSKKEGNKEDALETAEAAKRWGADFIWLDGYQFNEKYQALLKKAGLRVGMMDDFCHLKKYTADLVINPNTKDLISKYHRDAHTKILAGPSYVFFRRTIANGFQGLKRVVGRVKNILITLGGSDPQGITLRVLKAFQNCKLESARVTVLVGALNPRLNEIQNFTRNLHIPTHVIVNADDLKMSQIYSKTDLAITAAGSTAWELALYQIPSLLIQTADNQCFLVKTMSQVGGYRSLGSINELTSQKIAKTVSCLIKNSEKRRQMIKSCRGIVDQKGPARILSQLEEQNLRLRNIKHGDARQIWDWANLPEVRAISFSQGSIPWNQHLHWFRKKLKDKNCFFWIAQVGKQNIGQIRYEKIGSSATISLVLDRKWRNRGYGNDLLRKSLHQVFRIRSIRKAEAFTLIKNDRSSELFKRMGFHEMRKVKIQGKIARRFVLKNDASK